MPRYIVQRSFPRGLDIAVDGLGARACAGIVAANASCNVTWLHSYVTEDRRKSFCLYDGPTPESIRETARGNGLSVDSITSVQVLDPYFHHG